MSKDFDFGFTAVDEHELDAVQKAQSEVDDKVEAVLNRFDKLYSAIIPLLENLKKNPEREYIYWPNRVQKVDAFKKYIDEIFYNNE